MRGLLIALGVVVVLLVAAVFAVPALVPTSTIVAKVESAVTGSTGRAFKIKGPVSLSVLPSLAVTADDVTLAGVKGGADLLHIQRLELRLALFPLLGGNVEVDTFVLKQPQVALEVDRQGKGNWQFAGASQDSSGSGMALNGLQLGAVKIDDGTFTYRDAQSGASHKVEKLNLAVSLKSLDTPFDIDSNFKLDGRDASVDGTVGVPRVLLEGGPTPIKLTLKAPDTEASLDGQVTMPKGEGPIKLAGALKAKAGDLPATLAWLTAAKPANLPVKSIDLAAKIDGSTDRLALNDLALKADDITVTGSAAASLAGARPDLKAQIKVSPLDIDRILPPASAASKGAAPAPAPAADNAAAAPAKGWSREPLDLSALKLADADLQVAIDGIKGKGVEIGATTLTAVIKDGRLNAKLADTGVFGGKIGGTAAVDGHGEVPAINVAARIEGVQAEPLLTRFADFSRLSGTMAGDLSLQGAGKSQYDLVKTLGGNGKLVFRDGALKGVNLGKLVRSVTGGGGDGPQQTDFAELGASFQMQNGVAHTEDIRMVAPLLRVDGKGNVMLPEQQVDMRIVPKLVASGEGQGGKADLGGIAVPILVRGSFDNLSYTPDVKGIAEQALKNPGGIKGTVDSLKGALTGQGSGGTGEKKNPLGGLLQGLTGGTR